ncbi:MAG: hypothetical protein J5I91_04300 [Bacteroidetes bacterium]|nr:hypothetical protein [Bacteroidota bacterium]
MSNRIVIIILLALNIVVGYLIFHSVKKDVDYTNQVRIIDLQVIDRLKEVQKAQLGYKDTKGKFADNFDSLIHFYKFEKYMEVRSIGDLDKDSLAGLEVDTVFSNPLEKVFGNANYDIETIELVPPMDTAKFIISAGFIEKNDVKVPVFEVVDPHPFNKDRTLKVGSMKEAIYSGNWK